MKHKKEFMGLYWIVPALIFFCNPNLHLLDFLPDFFGYIFLCKAFSKLAELNEEIEDAVSLFRKMIWIDLGKWLMVFFTFSMTSAGEQESSLLLWTFVFSVVELLVLIPAYTKLFYGMTKLGYFYSNTAVLGTVKGEKSATDRVKRSTLMFVCCKSIFTVLPEFAVLSKNLYNENGGLVDIYRYVGLLRGFFMLLILVFGIVWLVRTQFYFSRIRGDQTLILALAEAYKKDVKPKVGGFVQKRFTLAYVFLVAGLIFSIDFRIDDILFFPDFLVAIGFVFVFFVLSKIVSLKKAPWIISCGVYFVTAIASFVIEERFFLQYSYQSIIKNDVAMFLYTAFVICNCLKAITFLITLFLLCRALFKTISVHTGTMIGTEYIDDRVKTMEIELHKELCQPVIVAMISSVVYAISDICYDVFAPMLSGIYVEGESVFGSFVDVQNHYGWLKTLNIGLWILCLALFAHAMSTILSFIQNKYTLE